MEKKRIYVLTCKYFCEVQHVNAFFREFDNAILHNDLRIIYYVCLLIFRETDLEFFLEIIQWMKVKTLQYFDFFFLSKFFSWNNFHHLNNLSQWSELMNWVSPKNISWNQLSSNFFCFHVLVSVIFITQMKLFREIDFL